MRPDRFLEVARALLAEGRAVRFRARGWSMAPELRDGDLLTIVPRPRRALRRGDVAFFTLGTRVLAHRVVGRDAAEALICRGDHWLCDPERVPEQAVLGLVVAVNGCDTPLPRPWRRPRWLGHAFSAASAGLRAGMLSLRYNLKRG